nr:hypothetical protein [Desulfosarcina ovata]
MAERQSGQKGSIKAYVFQPFQSSTDPFNPFTKNGVINPVLSVFADQFPFLEHFDCGGRQHAKVQMVADGLRMTGLRVSAADVVFQFLEQGFDLPAGPIVFANRLSPHMR